MTFKKIMKKREQIKVRTFCGKCGNELAHLEQKCICEIVIEEKQNTGFPLEQYDWDTIPLVPFMDFKNDRLFRV